MKHYGISNPASGFTNLIMVVIEHVTNETKAEQLLTELAIFETNLAKALDIDLKETAKERVRVYLRLWREFNRVKNALNN